MKTLKKIGSLVAGLALGIASQAGAAFVNVDVYSGFSGSGDGTPFTGKVGSLTPSWTLGNAIDLTDGYNWHPFGLTDFGVQVTGAFTAATDGTYSFSTQSDDGSALYVDGYQVVNNGDAHGPTTVNGTINLTAGAHQLVVNFFEAYGGTSDLFIQIDQNLTPTAVPEPSTLIAGALLLVPFGASVVRNMRKNKAQ